MSEFNRMGEGLLLGEDGKGYHSVKSKEDADAIYRTESGSITNNPLGVEGGRRFKGSDGKYYENLAALEATEDAKYQSQIRLPKFSITTLNTIQPKNLLEKNRREEGMEKGFSNCKNARWIY